MYNVRFPNLNLEFQIDRVAFSVGDFNIYWYGLLIAVGVMFVMLTAFYLAKKWV